MHFIFDEKFESVKKWRLRVDEEKRTRVQIQSPTPILDAGKTIEQSINQKIGTIVHIL